MSPDATDQPWQRIGDHCWLHAHWGRNGDWGETNTALISQGGASVVVDTPWDVSRTDEFLHFMAERTKAAPVTHVVNTHADLDHWWGNAAMPTEAQIVCTQTTAHEMRAEATPPRIRTMIRAASVGKYLPGPAGCMSEVMLDVFDRVRRPRQLRWPDQTFTDAHDLDVDGLSVQLREHGPTHTASDLVIWVPDSGVVFTGDLMFTGSTPVMWHGPLTNWLTALTYLRDLDAAAYVPGHGPLSTRDDVQRQLEYWLWVQQEGGRRLERGESPARAASQMLRSREARAWLDWHRPERLAITLGRYAKDLDGTAPKSPGVIGRAIGFAAAGRTKRDLAHRPQRATAGTRTGKDAS